MIVSATASGCSWISFSMKVVVAALLGGVLVPGDLQRRSRVDGPPSASMTVTALGVTVTISPFLIPRARPGLREERGDRRGHEVLALAEADDQRALLAGRDQRVRVVGVHGDERVMTAELGEGGAHRLGQVALVVALDQVGDDLGVGLGAELVPLGDELAAQLGMVLDDPVEDDVDLVRRSRRAGGRSPR